VTAEREPTPTPVLPGEKPKKGESVARAERLDGKAWRGLHQNGIFVLSGKKLGVQPKIKDKAELALLGGTAWVDAQLKRDIAAIAKAVPTWKAVLIREALKVYVDAVKKHGTAHLKHLAFRKKPRWK